MFETITVNLVFGYILVLCRIGSTMMLLPGIGEQHISPRIRAMLAVGVSLIIFPLAQSKIPQLPTSHFALILLTFGEIIIGFFMGMMIRIIISTLHIAGQVISFQAGLAQATLFDPSQGTQGSLIGTFLTLLSTLIMFSTNLHHVFFYGLIDSYTLFPPNGGPDINLFSSAITDTVAQSFLMGFKIASPQIIIGLLTYLAAGIMGRLMPQMQVFFVIIPVKIVIGYVILLLTLSLTMTWYMDYFRTSLLPLRAF